ncbi:MAG: acyltransferase, partial [Pirellulales bacterium]|nr:acyltransferase [Pirellulales bacterium]
MFVGEVMKVAAVQFQHQANELADNFAIIRRYAVAASKIGVRLISFPECCLTGYWHLRHLNRQQLECLAEPIPDGVYSVKIRELANDLNLTIGVGLLEMTKNGRLFNSYFVANPNGTYACHRKIHCFINSEIDSGDEYTVFSGPDDVPIGVLICYDNNI